LQQRAITGRFPNGGRQGQGGTCPSFQGNPYLSGENTNQMLGKEKTLVKKGEGVGLFQYGFFSREGLVLLGRVVSIEANNNTVYMKKSQDGEFPFR